MSQPMLSALNRFGFGANIQRPASTNDPRAWLKQQLLNAPMPAAIAALPNSLHYLQREYIYLQERKALRKKMPASFESTNLSKKEIRQKAVASGQISKGNLYHDSIAKELSARLQQAINTPYDFHERLTHFWSNHFAISLDKRVASLYAAPMEREAIRPNVNGSFKQMLLAVTQHPAMLLYLDNVRSVGEDSRFVTTPRKKVKNNARASGVNENLAREILELHTLGVNGGYTQTDVAEFARALTGWSVPRRQASNTSNTAFVFIEATHQPGTRRVLGQEYRNAGVQQAETILQDLALHPATAKHLAFKLARHFVSDTPPASLVERMAHAYLKHDSQLASMYHAMIDSDEAWSSDARKFKTPVEFIISAFRSSGIVWQGRDRQVSALLERMGHLPFMSRSPEGYGDTMADWSGPDALFKRLQAAGTLAEWSPRNHSTFDVAKYTLGDQFNKETMTAIQRAESSHQALSLLFASPAFQWRS